jgi:hypothetical protein
MRREEPGAEAPWGRKKEAIYNDGPRSEEDDNPEVRLNQYITSYAIP